MFLSYMKKQYNMQLKVAQKWQKLKLTLHCKGCIICNLVDIVVETTLRLYTINIGTGITYRECNVQLRTVYCNF